MADASFECIESTVLKASEEKTNGTRLARLLIDGGTHALRAFLHTIHPAEKLQDVIRENKQKLQALKKRGAITESQWEKLFPSSGEPPDSRVFDISLLHLLLREICDLTKPSTGWHTLPVDDDTSPEANITRVKCFRNGLCHKMSTGVTNDEFKDSWNKLAGALMALGLDHQEVDHLKTDPIDHDTQRRVDEEVKRLDSDYKVELQNLKQDVRVLQDQFSSICESIGTTPPAVLSSCLPDEHPQMFGRSTEIQQITEAVQSGGVSVVLITGGPGFGKTTLANKVAHKLAKTECGKIVLCCSLRSQATLKHVANEMIHVCSTNIAQSPENPIQWLLNWSKQGIQDIVFVLDDADDIFESDEKHDFVIILSKLRMLSQRNITFIITSRTGFSFVLGPNMQINTVNLSCLSVGEAEEILLSRVEEQKTGRKLRNVQRMVELCGGVPLALCIVGSLLSECTEDKLVTRLETQLLDTLKNDEVSVEKVIKTSFDLLCECDKRVLVLLSAFPGSFSADAGEAVIKSCSWITVQPHSILRSLKHRSLIERPSSCRYQIHQLIQAFVRKIGQQMYPCDLKLGKHLVCSHFISRISENSAIYWRKDSGKYSIESFNEDRHNFEYFLQVYVDEMANQNPDIVERTTMFLDNFPQKCMYLEMCVLPKVYMEFLRKMLRSLHEYPVHKIELLCLLGHESRKVGDRDAYKKYMKDAGTLYLSNGFLRGNALSKVLFLNSLARILSEERKATQAKKLYDISFKECIRSLGLDHPETAVTLLLVGRQAKRLKYRKEADEKLRMAISLFSDCIGKHFMTAQALKDLADFYFLPGETDTEIDNSCALYETALVLMKELGLEDHKECILTLRNLAICHKKKGNLEEAMRLLQRASNIAERELDTDHKWKVFVMTNLAVVYLKAGNEDEAQAMMTQALEMCHRLKLSINKLPNQVEILRLFPGRFPPRSYRP